MTKVKKGYGICPCCMEKHDIVEVVVSTSTIYNSVRINYLEKMNYCELTGDCYCNEDQMSENYARMLDAYNLKTGEKK